MNRTTFIAAPFGNWVKPIGCIPVCGTFTLHPQGNRVWSVIKSLRYNFKRQGWTNNLGLPNPGVKVGLERHIRGEVLSIAEIEKNDFKKLIEIIPEGTTLYNFLKSFLSISAMDSTSPLMCRSNPTLTPGFGKPILFVHPLCFVEYLRDLIALQTLLPCG